MKLAAICAALIFAISGQYAVAQNTWAGGATVVTLDTRVVPRHLATTRLRARGVVTPKGYKSAWKDDRLNPRRAEGSLRGMAQMNLVWTRSVPRRLIDQRSGQDVTALVALVYPYTDLARQRRELGDVVITRHNGRVIKQVLPAQ